MKRTTMSLLILSSLSLLTACGGSSSDETEQPVEPETLDVVITSAEPNNAGIKNNLTCNNHNAAQADKKFCDITMYQVMVESFQDGDKTRGYGDGYGTSDHNGDIKGITNSINYIKDLGINSLWITPIFNSSEGSGGLKLNATGYFAKDYFHVDPHFGSAQDLEELTSKAHNNNISVFLDGVLGHSSENVLSSLSGIIPKTSTLCIDSDGNTDQTEVGECFDWSNIQTINFFNELFTYTYDTFKIDGWRMDQAYQVPSVEQWNIIRKEIEGHYKNSTNPHTGYVVGEILSSNQQMVDRGYGTSKEKAGLLSTFSFNQRYALVQALACEESGTSNPSGTRLLKGITEIESTFPSFAVPNMFLTNHDLVRFGDLLQRAKIADTTDSMYWDAHKSALSYLASYSGPITIYYGDEIGQEVPNFSSKVTTNCSTLGLCDDHVSRDNGNINIDSFTTEQKDLHSFVKKALKLRKNYPAMTEGAIHAIKIDDNSFIIEKYINGKTPVILAMNTSATHQIQYTLSDSAIKNAEDVLVNPITCEVILKEGSDFKFNLNPKASAFFIPTSEADPETLCIK